MVCSAVHSPSSSPPGDLREDDPGHHCIGQDKCKRVEKLHEEARDLLQENPTPNLT